MTSPEDAPEPIRDAEDSAFADETQFMGENTPGSASFSAGSEEWIGRQLGKYELKDVIGVGGMGVVYRAHDRSIDRDVAIKVLPKELSADETALKRFQEEARSAGKLSHANIVTIYDVVEEEGLHFLVMELVTGGTVSDPLKNSDGFPVRRATRMLLEAARGLAAAHRLGMIHRDIKPSNLLLTDEGTIKISDFGLAKRLHSQEQTLEITQEGQVVGTPYFMSPEQCEARPVDARSDIYSLGATYYTLLTGKNPFEDSESVVQVMYGHCNGPRPDPCDQNPAIPEACSKVIERAMAIKPADRYQSCEELIVDLEAINAVMSGNSITLPSVKPSSSGTNPMFWVGTAGVLAALLAIVLMFPSQPGQEPPKSNFESDASASDDNAPAIIAPKGEPVKIGLLHSLTGTMSASESPVVDAALLAIEEINSTGGVLGRPVKPIVADGRSEGVIFAREARRLIEEEQVVTVFGCWTSASRKTVLPVFEELDHLLVYPVQYEGLEESPNVIYTGAAPNQQIIPAVKWAFAFDGKRKFFLVGSDYVFPHVAHEIIKDQLQELGATFSGEAYIPLGGMDVEQIVQKIQETQPDVILNTINGDSNNAFFSALRAAGITSDQIPTISFSIGEAELQHLDPSQVAGDYAAWNYFQSLETTENERFVNKFRERYGPQRVITDPMEAAYFGILLWAEAVELAQSTETSVIRREMRNQRMEAPEGNVRVDPGTQHTFKTPRIGKVLPNGQFEIVWTAAKPAKPEPYPTTRTAEEWRALLNDLYRGWGNQWSAPVE